MDSSVGFNLHYWLLWLLLLFGCRPDKSSSSAAMMSDLWSSKDSALSSNVGGVHHENRVMTMPSFDASLPLNLTIQYGAHAHLVCRVTDLANKSVSWIRKRDGHLLTVDTDTFIGDGRFQVHHPVNSDTWTLHLRGVRGSDAGKYECQVSSEPKLSLVYQLNVVVPQVEIRGAPDIYVMAGSGVALHCVISGLIDTPPYIFWYHKTERIAGSALDESRIFDVGSKEATPPVMPVGATKNGWSARVTRLGPDSLLAVLNVPPATPDFAGNYSCGPPSLQLASVTLHVLNGEQPAAMQHGKNGAVGGVVIQSTGWLSMAFVTLFLMMAVNVMSATSRTVMAVTDGEQEDDQVCNSTSAGTAASGAKKKRLVDDWSFSTTISSIDGGGLRMMEAAESPSVDDVLKPPCRMMTTHSSRSS